MAEYHAFVGVDWGDEKHQAYALDGAGKRIKETVFEHSGEGIRSFARWVSELAPEGERVAVSIETPRGALVEALLERCFHVYSVNPKQLDRFRDRFFPSGTKDDRRDAMVLADSVRTDRKAFRRVRLDPPRIIMLRELTREDESLDEEARRLTNRLRASVHRYFPQLLALCDAMDEPWMWSLLEASPDPSSAKELSLGEVASILRRHRIRRLRAEDVLAAIRRPAIRVAEGTVEAARRTALRIVERLRPVADQRRETGRAIKALLEELAEPTEDGSPSTVEILRSMPGIGVRGAARLLAEATQLVGEGDVARLRMLMGVAPVTKATGKRDGKKGRKGRVRQPVIVMRHACSRRLRNMAHHWGSCAMQRDQAAREHYGRLRAKNHSHGRAVRSVVDRLLRILGAMLRDRTCYVGREAVQAA